MRVPKVCRAECGVRSSGSPRDFMHGFQTPMLKESLVICFPVRTGVQGACAGIVPSLDDGKNLRVDGNGSVFAGICFQIAAKHFFVFGSFVECLYFRLMTVPLPFSRFAIFSLPFRGFSDSIKGQNAPIVVGGCVDCISVWRVAALLRAKRPGVCSTGALLFSDLIIK